MKTANQILLEVTELHTGTGYTAPCLVEAMQEYSALSVDQAVTAALNKAAERAYTKMHKSRNGCKLIVDPESILSLKEEVINDISF